MKHVIMVMLAVWGSCSGVFGQSQLVTYDFKNTPLSAVIEEFKKQTEADFAFDNFSISREFITQKGSNQSLQQALELILGPTDFHSIWVGNTCIIARKTKEQSAPAVAYHDVLTTIIVSGTILDSESSETLPFVSLYNVSSKQSFMTNTYGQFHCTFQMAHPEDTIVFQFVGYETKKLLLSQLRTNQRIEMIPKRLYLPTVMITAGSNPIFERDADQAHLVFNPNDIVSSDALGESDIYRMTQLLPGVSSNQENSGGLLIRGSNGDQTLMQLDGFTIYHQDHMFGMFSSVNSQAVKNVRLHKSTPHSRIGGRIGGLLEMVGKEGNTRQGVTQINLGMLSGALSVEGPLDTAGTIGFIFNGRRAYTDGWFSPTYRRIFSTVYNSALVSIDSTQNQTFENQNDPAYYFQDANVKLSWKPTTRHTLNVSTYISSDQLYIHYADTSSILSELSPKVQYTDESRWKNIGASLQFLYHPLPSEHFLARITLSEYDATYFSTDTILAINQLQSIRIQNMETTLRNVKITSEKQWAKTFHTTCIGAESEHVVSLRDNAYSIVEIPQDKQFTWWHSVYAQDDWSPSLRWRIHSGMRLTWDEKTNRFLPEPRATIVYRLPLQRLRFEVGYARLHQLIHRLREQNLYQNNPDYWALSNGSSIPILASNQFNVGLHQDFSKGHVHLDLFSRQNQGSSLFLGSLPGYDQSYAENATDQLINGKSQSYGIEISTFLQHKNHQLLTSYTWLTANSSYSNLDNQLINANHEHRHEAKIYYEWQSKHWSYGLFWTYGSGRPYTPVVGTYPFTFPNGDQSEHVIYGNFNSRRLPAYHRLDLSLQYQWSGLKTQWEIGASVYNAYNRMNIRSRQYFLKSTGDNLSLLQNDLNMLGLVPSIQMQIRF